MCALDDSNNARAMRETPFFGAVCLLGLGVTGRAVVDFFLNNPSYISSLTIYSGDVQPENQIYLRSLPDSIEVHEGVELVSGSFDTAIVSPGIPPHSSLYLSATKVAQEIISEPELAWRISPQRWIAVTGTNGKTTVTALIAALLETAGKTAWAAGNIGTPCIEVVASRKPGDWLVAELSSYQLHSTSQLAPDIALLLNITPDHLSWHRSHKNYSTDKQRILANLAPDAPAILDVSRSETRAIADDLSKKGKRVIRIGSAKGLTLQEVDEPFETAFVRESTGALTLELSSGTYRLLQANKLGIRGAHNLSNALAAAAAAAEVGASAAALSAGLASFVPLSHRFEPCGEFAGVSFINDSKATNIDAALKAITTFADDAQAGTLIAMLGGLDKGTDLEALVSACRVSCRYAVCYGEAGERFFSALSAKMTAVLAKSFDEAFVLAFKLSVPGDTILLSPACASFDEFDSFSARGEHFKACVAKLRSGRA